MIFPILLIMSFLLNRPAKHFFLISIIALITVLIIWKLSFSKNVHAANFDDLKIFSLYLLTYLGAPISGLINFGDPKVIGLIALILSLAMVMPKLVPGAKIYKSDLILSGIVVFVMGTAFVTTLGRYKLRWIRRGKFASLCNAVLLLWCCLLLWIYLVASRRSKPLYALATATALLVALGFQIAGSRFVEKADIFMGKRYTAETALLSGVPDHDALLTGQRR